MGSIPTEDTAVFGISPRQINARTWKHRVYNEWAFLSPSSVIKSEYLRECSASRVWPYMHQLRIMSLVKCWVCPAPGFAALRSVIIGKGGQRRTTTCNCALVIPDEHLSRESRKLTVMIQRETGQPLEDSSESLGFLCINKGPFHGQVHTRPYPDAREGTRGYIVAPPSNSYG